MIIKILTKVLKKLLERIEQEKKGKYFSNNANVSVSDDLIIGNYNNIQIPSKNIKLVIKQRVSFREFCNILIYENAELVIGENVFFNNYCSINCLQHISIGENTIFGEGVKLYDHNHLHEFNPNLIIHRANFSTAPINIGKNCWIASNVTILKGVTIGDNVIIGANNLIYKSVPSNSIVKSNLQYTIQSV
jgi:acetyltransferase-like isoleucine patch superfamily enzyme